MTYSVKEIFDTFQGEGARAGTRAVFVRFAGCNLWNGLEADRSKGKGACARWCDTDFAKGDKMTARQIVEACDRLWPRTSGNDESPRWVVITGGEPTLQWDEALEGALHSSGWMIAMETNGTLDPDEGRLLDAIDYLCVSPKIGGKVLRAYAHELKVVVPGNGSPNTGWGDKALQEMDRDCTWEQVFLQPQDGPEAEKNLALTLAMLKRNPRWRLSLQTHKMIGLP